ncbi:acylneuraminate cytidylyltransferase [Hymenobacter sp. PAMC 26628]|nr:acylneuraminate cytidylyltransferase [Hymenobacter sp. PAMC 26628]
MRIGIVSQARMTSTRLPGKVLLRAGGDSLLGCHLRRLRQTGLPVLLATTTNATDDVLAAFGKSHDVPVTRGDEHDVLGRFQLCAQENDLEAVVRVTSDCPFIAPELIVEGVARYRAAADPRLYLSNVLRRTYPRGFDFEIFSRELLDEAAQRATLPAEREHVTPYINQNRAGTVHLTHLTRAADASRYRLTVDTPEDFALVRVLLADHAAGQLSGEALIELLSTHPELVALNATVEQKKI